MSSQTATIELPTADVNRTLNSSFLTGIEKVVIPLLDKHVARTDTDIQGLRQQITANLEFLTAGQTANLPAATIHIITFGNAPNIRAYVYAGKSAPVSAGDPAPTTAGALTNLLKKTQSLLVPHLFGDNVVSVTNMDHDDDSSPGKSTPPTTPSTSAEKTEVGALAVKGMPVTPKDRQHDARFKSTQHCLWGSSVVMNPAFSGAVRDLPKSKDAGVVDGKVAGFGSDAQVDLSFGSAADSGDGAVDGIEKDVKEVKAGGKNDKVIDTSNGKPVIAAEDRLKVNDLVKFNMLMDKKANDKKAVDKKAVHMQVFNNTPVDMKAFNNQVYNNHFMDKRAMAKRAFNNQVFDQRFVGQQPIDNQFVGHQFVNQHFINNKLPYNQHFVNHKLPDHKAAANVHAKARGIAPAARHHY